MARPRDPRRRVELLDAILDYLVEHGIAQLSLRPLAEALGHSTFVLTHHFSNKDDLIAAVLAHLDERQRSRLRALPGWAEGRSLGAVVRASWDWHLAPDSLPLVRLLHEIEGLAAAGRLRGSYVPTMLGDRAEFVAEALQTHGVPADVARRNATLLNAAYAGLQLDYLTTGDRDRVESAVDELVRLTDEWTRHGSGTQDDSTEHQE
ncbi:MULTISPECIES: TetR/AcrR family transcriptional regulator [Actinoalloteichus]|uniref:Transcriptional regulator, TetR family n=1 Tax=Actinoalloteichus fjordicus TaxID=1612552 RepID=A0AAC9LF85_9PSEU|nr:MULTISPECIES: TetR/AcrR family transcriptional regulator [Actinoalloteichus]APU15134.1 transcriptional regulator, TetR family [Actinoalloteichus fjordicus]APU21202.1 transcriptional regulator, TetR family [Actinoalloteichus sp. GBA129-24]